MDDDGYPSPKAPERVRMTAPQDEFLQRLRTEKEWEWRWQALAHSRWQRLEVLALASQGILLAFAVFQFGQFPDIGRWAPAVIAGLAVLNVLLPQLNHVFRFRQRQELHDETARAYEVIEAEFMAGQIGLEQAVKRFTDIRSRPTERVLRGMP